MLSSNNLLRTNNVVTLKKDLLKMENKNKLEDLIRCIF
jgi:hypothetical protein